MVIRAGARSPPVAAIATTSIAATADAICRARLPVARIQAGAVRNTAIPVPVPRAFASTSLIADSRPGIANWRISMPSDSPAPTASARPSRIPQVTSAAPNGMKSSQFRTRSASGKDQFKCRSDGRDRHGRFHRKQRRDENRRDNEEKGETRRSGNVHLLPFRIGGRTKVPRCAAAGCSGSDVISIRPAHSASDVGSGSGGGSDS